MEEFGLGATALSTMTLAMLTLEFGKLIVRRLILKNPTYDFPSWVYVVFPPVLNTLWVVPLAYLGFQGFAVPASWADWGRNLLRALLRQRHLAPRGSAEQVLSVLAVSEGWLDGVSAEQAPRFVQSLLLRLRGEAPAIAAALDRDEAPEQGWLERVSELAARLRPEAAT